MLSLFRNRFRTMPGHFRSNVWDPVLIISQIVTLVCEFYCVFGLWIYLMDIIGKFDASRDQIFTQTDLDLLEDSGRVNVIAFLLNSLTSALALWFVVQKSKLCLDFSMTVHFFHFLCCWIYNGHIPQTLPWWIINIISVALMTVIGEFLCMRSEMKAIPVGMGPRTDLWFLSTNFFQQ